MFRNYLTSAIRNLLKYKAYSLINILGLAIGMTCCIMIMLFVQNELSYDQSHENKDRIFRVELRNRNLQTGEINEWTIGPYRLAEALRVDFPEISRVIRFSAQSRVLIHRGEKMFREEHFHLVDPGVLEAFTFPLLRGNPQTALQEPFTVVITEEIANKYFGNEDPMGQVLTYEDHDFKVTGILDEVPANTHLPIDLLSSMTVADQLFSRIVLENWSEMSVYTYVFLPPNMDAAEIEKRFPAFVEKHLPNWAASVSIFLRPLASIHLYSQSNIVYIYSFSAIAFFVLLIACINFMNLATARSASRAREVGLRKVVGAYRSQLVQQFLGESVLTAAISLLLSLIMVKLTLPAFNAFIEKDLVLDIAANGGLLLGLVSITLFVGLAAGIYPALFLASFEPVKVLKGIKKASAKGPALRKIMVAFQFTISIILIVVTMIVYRQLQYAKNLNLGFNKEHIVVIRGTPHNMRQQYDQVRMQLLQNPKIIAAAGTSRVPPGSLSSSIGTRPEGIPEDQRKSMQTIWMDFDFIEILGLEIVAGRSFSRDFPSDVTSAFVLNEQAVRKIGWTPEEAIGKSFGSSEIKDWNLGQWIRREGQVIGVVKDFHFESLHDEIVPTVYFIAPYMAWNYLIRIQPGDIPGTLAFLEKKWQTFNPEVPFEYSFLDDAFDTLYRTEEKQGKIFGIFALLAVFIGCLGLVGLASFTAESSTKEIGIRKVLGSSVIKIVLLMTKDFTKLVLIANVIAWPIAYLVMRKWLQSFAYRIDIGVFTFLMAGALTLIIAWVTVSYQAIRASLINPADALRYE